MFGDEISEPEHAEVATVQQKVLEQLSGELDDETVLRHFTLLPEKYALYTPLQQILSHIRLCERLHDQPVVTLWTPHPQSGYTELVVSTLDSPRSICPNRRRPDGSRNLNFERPVEYPG